MASPIIPVLVVGGGLGGFTAALALHRAGIRNRLILKERSFGAGVRSAVLIAGSAVRILDRLGLGPRFRTYGSPIIRGEIENERGKPLISIDTDRIGSEVWVVPRAGLQQFFVEALPPDSVHFGSKLRSLQTNPDHVVAEVQTDENMHQLQEDRVPLAGMSRMAARLVIGADGLRSTVRSCMSRPTLAIPSGTYVWQAVVRNQDTDAYPPHTGREVWMSSTSKIPKSASRFGFIRMTRDDVLWWAVTQSGGDVLLRPFLPKLRAAFQEYPDSVGNLIASIESDRDIHRRQLHHVWPSSIPRVDHASGRIALVGDAGRVGEVTNLHHGCSFAIEDSYMLAHYIAEQGGPEASQLHLGLRAYEQNREAHTAKAKFYTKTFHKLSTSQSALSRYFLRKHVLASLESEASRGIALTSTS